MGAREVFSLVGRIGLQGMQQVNKDIAGAEKAVKTFQKELGKLGANLSRVGSNLSKNLTLPLVAAGTALGVLSLKTGEYASKILSMSESTGLTTDALQEFENVARKTGVSSDSLLNTTQQLRKRLDGIRSGTGDAAEAMDILGISVTNSDGSLRNMNDLFPQILGELNKIEDTTERNIVASKIFGQNMDNLAPVLAMTAEEIANVRKEAHEAGRVMANDALVNADEFRVSVENLKAEFGVMTMQIASSFIPILQNQVIPLIYDKVVPAIMTAADKIKGLAEWFGNLNPVMQNTVIIMAAVVAAIGPVVMIGGKMILMLKGLIAGIVGATGALKGLYAVMAANPIGLVIAAVASLTLAMTKLIERHKRLKEVDALNKQSEELSKRSKWLFQEAIAAKKLVEEYKKLEGTAAFDPAEMARLQSHWERYTIELRNTAREMQGLGKLSREDEENIRRRMRGQSEYSETAKKAEAGLTDFQRAEIRKRQEAARKAAAERIKELNQIVKSYQEKINGVLLNEVKLSEMQEGIAVNKAHELGAAEEQIEEIRYYYQLLREKRELEHAQSWESRLINQSGDRTKIMESSYRADIAAAEKAGQDTANIHEYYASLRANIERDLAKSIEDANQVWIDRLQKQQDTALTTQHSIELNAAKKRGESTFMIELRHVEERAAIRQRELAAGKAAALAAAAESGADVAHIEQYYMVESINIERDKAAEIKNIESEITEDLKRQIEKRQQLVASMVNFFQGAFNKMGSIAAGFSRNEEMRLSREYKERRNYINANVEDEEERATQLAALNEEEEARKLTIQKENAAREKALGMFNAVINTATAVTKALTAGPVAGPIMASIIAALGMAEISVIASTPQPFAVGGIVGGNSFTGDKIDARVNSGEMILTRQQQTRLFDIANGDDNNQVDAPNITNVNLHIGTLVADKNGLLALERKLRGVRISEDKRLGVS